MKQLLNVFRFEFQEYLKNKVFRIITIIGIAVIVISAFIPTIIGLFSFNGFNYTPPNVIVSGAVSEDRDLLNEAFKDKAVLSFSELNEEELKKDIIDKNHDSALILKGNSNYTYISSKGFVGDALSPTIYQLTSNYESLLTMRDLGLSNNNATNILSKTTNVDIQSTTGDNQIAGYILSYALVILMFVSIMIYGQLVSTSIASEKSSRTMEVLITYAKPKNLFFGKVLGSCFAGLFQLLLFMVTILIVVSINFKSLFSIPIVKSILVQMGYLSPYFIVFFLFGFLSFSFLFGAIGSLVSRIEDVNAAATPVVLLSMAVYIVALLSLFQVSIGMQVVFSFIPFFSPIVMFTRISMNSASVIEIIVAIFINILTILLSGLIGTKIYKMGVLLYGLRPSTKNIIKMISK